MHFYNGVILMGSFINYVVNHSLCDMITLNTE